MSDIPHSGRITLDPDTIGALVSVGRNVGHEIPAEHYSPGGWIERFALVQLIRAVEEHPTWRESVAVELEDAEQVLDGVGWPRSQWPT